MMRVSNGNGEKDEGRGPIAAFAAFIVTLLCH